MGTRPGMETVGGGSRRVRQPSAWSSHSHLLVPSNRGLKATYSGASERDAAAVRADCEISPSCGIFYFEVTIASRGQEGQISVGVCTKNAPLNRLPGWSNGSYGYHGGDGLHFSGSGAS